VAEPTEQQTYVFTKSAVVRSIRKLETCHIHEHFAGYLAILRAVKSNNAQPIRSADITEFHDRYLRVVGASEKAPYVRPFKSRGEGLETFNANVAGSYAPSSLRAKGKLIEVIDVRGERQGATYSLRADHATLARSRLLTSEVPVGALTAFLYRDYGFRLDQPDVRRIIKLFREEFRLSPDPQAEQEAFALLFVDDSADFTSADLEVPSEGAQQNG
jgi:hypothetical protein